VSASGSIERRVTRLAPSPTGALHLGNARTFLVNWLLARSLGWHIVLRIDDLDGPRVKIAADQQAMDDLRWLGLDWDAGPTFQTDRYDAYATAVARLLEAGLAYPCTCTRSEVNRASSAPHAEDGATVYPGTCRGRYASIDEARDATGREPAIRFRVEDDCTVRWRDAFAGEQSIRMSTLGDFVVAKSDGTAAYQLAVVIDDVAAGVTDVVRGNDLLDSTPRQMLLYEALNLGPPPTYYHLPLIIGPDGRRLAKRHGDTRLSSYRRGDERSPAKVLALLARWCDIAVDSPPNAARDLLHRFELGKLRAADIVLTAEEADALRRD
jgi:glutamyl-tRNA synthetase